MLILQNGTVRYLGSIHAVKSATSGDASLEEAFIAITSEPESRSA